MAGQGAAPQTDVATEDDWKRIERSVIDALIRNGQYNDRSLTDVHNAFIAARARSNLTRRQVQAIGELFEKRKDYADSLAKGVIDMGVKAGQRHIELQGRAKESEIDIAKLAGAEDISNQSIVQKKRAGWSGFFDVVGNFLEGCGWQQGADWCKNMAERLAPTSINAGVALGRLQQQRTSTTIDVNAPSILGLSVFRNAMLLTNPDTVGLGAAGGVQAQRDMAAIPGANAGTDPYLPLPGAGPATPPAGRAPAAALPPSPAASSANIADLTRMIIDRAKQAKVPMTEQAAGAVVGSALRADGTGDKDGKVDTPAEVAKLRGSTAYIGLNPQQRQIVDKVLGLPEPAPN